MAYGYSAGAFFYYQEKEPVGSKISPSVETFYVIQFTTPRGKPDGLSRNWGSTDKFVSYGAFGIDDVPHYKTLSEAMARWARNPYAPERYQIVRVDRTITPGRTVRTVVSKRHLDTMDKCVVAWNSGNGYEDAYIGNSSILVNTLEDARVFSDLADALSGVDLRSENYFATRSGVVLKVFNIRETITLPVTSDTLTVLK